MTHRMTHPNLTPAADILSAGAIIGSMMNLLPPLAALIAILWYAVQIFESDTVQGFFRHRRLHRLHRLRVHRRKRPVHHHHKDPPEHT